MKIKCQKGFTLIEVLLVVAIIGIISAIGTVSTRDMRGRFKLKSAALTLHSDLQLARLGAIRDGRSWSICFIDPVAPDFIRYTIGNSGGADGNICTDDDDPVREPSNPPVSGEIVDPAVFRKNVGNERDIFMTQNFSGIPPRVTFMPRGSASPGSIKLSLNNSMDKGQEVTVNQMTGNVSVRPFPHSE